MHEGLDIAITSGTSVLAVETGKITAIKRDGFNSYITIKDAIGNKGWNYKHVIADAKLAVNSKVNAGATILGVVAAIPGAIPLPDHFHLERGEKHDNEFNADLYIPSINPYAEFYGPGGVLTGVDVTKPVVGDIGFRIQRDDRLADGAAPSADKIGGTEKPRDTAHYFQNTTKYDGNDYLHIGKLAKATTAAGKVQPAGDSLTEVDIIANAFDTFGGGGQKLGVTKLEFEISGTVTQATQGITSGIVPAFNFAEFANVSSFYRISSMKNTRAIYENDTKFNSKISSSYNYILTNNKNAGDAPFVPTLLSDKSTKYFWNTDVARNAEWNAEAPNATENNTFDGKGGAQFPDGIYKVKVTAYDFEGNSGSNSVKVLVNNFPQKINAQPLYLPNERIMLYGGENFLAGQPTNIFAIPRYGSAVAIANDTPLMNFVDMVITDDAGQLPTTLLPLFKIPSPGFWLVGDYNNDGIYTAELDGAALICPTDEVVWPVPPVIYDQELDSGSATAGQPGVTLDPLANATNPAGIATSVQSVTAASHGTVTINPNGTITYLPEAGYFGGDSFIVTIVDIYGRTSTATITINVVNCRPNLRGEELVLAEDHVIDFDPKFNDYDCDQIITSVDILAEPAHGTIEFLEDNQIRYTPNADYDGTDHIIYGFTDNQSASGWAEAWLEITPVNDAPRTAYGVYSIPEGEILNGSAWDRVYDPDGDLLTLHCTSWPSHGSLTWSDDGDFTYIPDPEYLGKDSFTFTATDPSNRAVTVTVPLYVNAPTYATDDEFLPNGVNFILRNVLDNDTDANIEALTAVATSQPSHGTLTFLPNGLFLYTPEPGWTGEDGFTYEARDGYGGASAATVVLTVGETFTPPPLAPVGNGGEAQRSRLTSITIDFDTPVDSSFLSQSGAIQLTRTTGRAGAPLGLLLETGAIAGGRITYNTSSRWVTQLILTFDNVDGSAISDAVEYGSLADGRWLLTIPSLGYHSEIGGSNLHRLFGDVNNDGTVDGQDFAWFGSTFGKTVGNPYFIAAFDFNNDGTIDGSDFAEFGARFGLTI